MGRFSGDRRALSDIQSPLHSTNRPRFVRSFVRMMNDPLAARAPCVTMNLSTQFIRPVESGERLTVYAKAASRGAQVLHLTAEAFNSKNKLVAVATAGATVMHSSPRSQV